MSEQIMTTATYHTNPADDETLAQQIHRALDDIAPMGISIQVSNGLVTLSGVVATYSVKARILHVVRSAPGVQQVCDELLTDSELEIRIADALAADPRTRSAAHNIVSKGSNGWVFLEGQVPTYTLAEAAETVAASVPGVRAVSNCLQIGPQVGKRRMGFAG